jgi:hypothetical protein
MARAPLIIGPFSRGLNTYDDPTAVLDDELVEALNFDPGLEGSLKSRPPFQDLGDPLTLGATGDARLIGVFYDTNGDYYLLASDGLSSTWHYRAGVWTLITSTFAATDMAQFDGKAWLVSPVGEADPGGYWTPSGGFVADADMPHGEVIVSYKFRLWVAPGFGNPNGTRVYYSKVLGQPSFWASPGFVDVGAGDGQGIVALTTYYNSLVVFRSQSIYTFEYVTDPAQGAVQVLVPGVGLSSKDTLVSYENYLYFMYDEKAYEFINNRATQINIKVPFEATNQADIAFPFTVSAFNNRIIFGYYDTMYVFSLRTRTWTRWRSPVYGAIGQFISPLAEGAVDEAFVLPSKAVPTGGEAREVPLLFIEDRISTATEEFTCTLQTKNYSYKLASNFKRLYWWGVDAIFRGRVVAQAVPVSFNRKPTWGELRSNNKTWGDLLLGTWGNLFIGDVSILTEYDLEGLGSDRKFAKFKKGSRFRQIYFRLSFDTDGSIATAPVQVFTLSAYIDSKETVSKAVS